MSGANWGALNGGSGLPDPLGISRMDNGAFDPLHIFPANQPGGINDPSTTAPNYIPTLGGGFSGHMIPGINNPQFYGGSFSMPRGLSGFNQMAQNAAGPIFDPMKIKKPMPPMNQSIPGGAFNGGGSGGGKGGLGNIMGGNPIQPGGIQNPNIGLLGQFR